MEVGGDDGVGPQRIGRGNDGEDRQRISGFPDVRSDESKELSGEWEEKIFFGCFLLLLLLFLFLSPPNIRPGFPPPPPPRLSVSFPTFQREEVRPAALPRLSLLRHFLPLRVSPPRCLRRSRQIRPPPGRIQIRREKSLSALSGAVEKQVNW